MERDVAAADSAKLFPLLREVAHAVRFLSFDSSKVVKIADLNREPEYGFSVSPDGRSLLFAEYQGISSDLFKTFVITERWKVQFRSEFFNLPNHPNFRGLDTTYDDPSAGELTSAQPGRQVQFALKLLF